MKPIKHGLLALFGSLLLAAFAANAQDARPNSIEAMIVAQHAGVLNVKLTFREPLTAVPAGFSIAKPARRIGTTITLSLIYLPVKGANGV